MTYPFGLSEADAKELERIMDDMGKLAQGPDWYVTKRDDFLALQARLNELVPPGSMP